MSTAFGVIIVILAIIFWRITLSALAGAFIFGLIGNFFGETARAFGILIGFFLGLFGGIEQWRESKRSQNKESPKPEPEYKPQPDPSPDTASNNNKNAQIISCPECNQRISIIFPPKGKTGKCPKCSSRFNILVGEDGKVYAQAIPSENSSSTQNDTVNTQIISCPQCNQRIRISLPPKGKVGKCAKCSTRFNIVEGQDGRVYAEDIPNNKSNTSTDSILTLQDAFDILEVTRNAGSDQIRFAYKKKISEYHPDKVETLGPKLKEVAILESARINKAYAMLEQNGYV